MKRITTLVMVFFVLSILLAGCGVTTDRMSDAQKAAPAPESSSTQGEDFRERDQILMADYMSNRTDVLFFGYYLADDGRLIDQWICQGKPASSTESIEPNLASPTGLTSGYWNVLVDGHNASTTEVMGIDGTYDTAVPYLFCFTPEGHYEQWSPYASVRISTMPRTFAEPMVRVDESQFVKMEAAKLILQAGGCVDSNLNEIECSVVEGNLNMDLHKKQQEVKENIGE